MEGASIKSSLPAKLQERLNASGNYSEQKDEVQAWLQFFCPIKFNYLKLNFLENI